MFTHKFHDHAIKTKNKIFFFDFNYNLFITKFEILWKYLNNNFKKKFIVFFSSFANAFIMFVKKNGNLRLCVNYKNPNFIIVKNRYFVSLIKQLLNRLIETAIFTKINIRSTYNVLQIELTMNKKLFFDVNTNILNIVWCFLNWRMRQQIFNRIFIWHCVNIQIYLNDKKTHEKHVQLIFEKLRKFKLFANFKKCFFDLNKIDYLK